MNWNIHIHPTLIGAICAISMVTIYAHESDAAADDSTMPPSSTVRDGSHDFDFIYGKGRMPNHRLKKRQAGSHEWGSAPKTVVISMLWSHEPGKTMAIDIDSIGGEVHTQWRSPL